MNDETPHWRRAQTMGEPAPGAPVLPDADPIAALARTDEALAALIQQNTARIAAVEAQLAEPAGGGGSDLLRRLTSRKLWLAVGAGPLAWASMKTGLPAEAIAGAIAALVAFILGESYVDAASAKARERQ